jgi:cysteine-rich repeat protein
MPRAPHGLLALFLVALAACGARSSLSVEGSGAGGAPATTATTATSTTVTGTPETCGDGVVQAGAGEECDDPDPNVCTPLCRAPRCGDGFVRPASEECDLGGDNADAPALVVENSAFGVLVGAPVAGAGSPVEFYDYRSDSAHTGFEGQTLTTLFLYQQAGVPGLSLFTIAGIDLDATGVDDGDCSLDETFSGLPNGVSVLLSDEPDELVMTGDGEATATFSYHHNSDGGILSSLPFPGDWAVRVDAELELPCLTTWSYYDGRLGGRALSTPTTILRSSAKPSACRADCTVPRCGDGLLDAGEVCDDGNVVGGDGCSADCSETEVLAPPP